MNKLMKDLGLPLLGKISKVDNFVETPWQDITPETAVIRALDNLISTYGEDFVLDLIGSAYVVSEYEK